MLKKIITPIFWIMILLLLAFFISPFGSRIYTNEITGDRCLAQLSTTFASLSASADSCQMFERQDRPESEWRKWFKLEVPPQVFKDLLSEYKLREFPLENLTRRFMTTYKPSWFIWPNSKSQNWFLYQDNFFLNYSDKEQFLYLFINLS